LTTQGVARVLQRRLETYYALEETPCVSNFLAIAEPGERETLLVRQDDEGVEMRLVVPECTLQEALVPSKMSDAYLQILEGVSHFVLLCERIRTGLPTSQLELELQAEVDKLVLISSVANRQRPREQERERLHSVLYEQVTFLHAEGTETGSRYRTANRLAARFTKRLSQLSPVAQRQILLRFYRTGLTEKVRLAQAA
jgi:hypothetical protein